MKLKYKLILSLLLTIAIVGTILIIKNKAEDDYISNAISFFSVFIAVTASMIAIALNDKNQKKINIEIKTNLAKENTEDYCKSDFNEKLKIFYSDFPENFKSRKLFIKIKNLTEENLINPVITFIIPFHFKHPSRNQGTTLKDIDNIYSGEPQLNSNLYNSPQNMKFLNDGKTQIISNNILPFLNTGDEIELWIRLATHHPIEFKMQINCDNLDGKTFIINHHE